MKYMLLYCVFLMFTQQVRAQGCSDAGACSIGGLKNKDHDHYVSLNFIYGVGEQNVHVSSLQAESVFTFGKRSGIQVKIPYVFVNGNLGLTQGLGDFTAVYSYRYYDRKNWQLGANAGLKLGVNDANKTTPVMIFSRAGTSPFSYPMPYQTSLGTHDLLLGQDARYKDRWTLGLAAQIPVYQFNRNAFDTSVFYPYETQQKQYFTSAKLLRRPDIVFRIDRQFKFLEEKLSFQVGVVNIYHLGHDRFTDRSGVSHAISGSKGLTLNMAFALSYRFNKQFSIFARNAFPLIVRKVRPDGLTRHHVSGLELRYNF